jgi:hypothetical protein
MMRRFLPSLHNLVENENGDFVVHLHEPVLTIKNMTFNSLDEYLEYIHKTYVDTLITLTKEAQELNPKLNWGKSLPEPGYESLNALKRDRIFGIDSSGEQTTRANKSLQNQKVSSLTSGETGVQQNSTPTNNRHLKYEIVKTDDGALFLIDVDKKEPKPIDSSPYATITLVGGEWMMSINGGTPFDVTNRQVLTFKTVKKVQKTNNAKDGKANVRQITEMPLSGHRTFHGKENPELEKLKDGKILRVSADPDDQTWLKWQNINPPPSKAPEKKKPPTKNELKGGVWIKAEIGNLYVKVKYFEDGTISDLYYQAKNDRNPNIDNPINTKNLDQAKLAEAMKYVTKVKNDLYKLQHDSTNPDFNKRLNKIIGNKKAEIDIGIPFNVGADPLHENSINPKTNPYSLDYNPDNTLYGETGGQRTARIGLAHELIGHGGDLENGTYSPEDKIDPSTVIPGVPGSGIPIEEEHAIKWENIERAALGEEQRTTWTSSYTDRPNYSYRLPDNFIVH